MFKETQKNKRSTSAVLIEQMNVKCISFRSTLTTFSDPNMKNSVIKSKLKIRSFKVCKND